MKTPRWAWAPLGAALFGCTGLGPPLPMEPVRPGPEPPLQWHIQAAAGVDSAGVEPEWWLAFGDPELDRLIARILEENRDLAAAAARVDAALAEARIAGAPRRPQAGVGIDGGRRRQNFIGLPIPGSEGGVLTSTTNSNGASLNVSWEADLWGRLRAAETAAVRAAAATEADLAAARLSLAGQSAKAWFAMREAELQVRLAVETVDSRRRTRERIERRFRLGLRPALELRLAFSNESLAEAALANRERRLDSARRQLRLLVSEYPSAEPSTADRGAALPAPPATLPAGLPAELVSRRPDLYASENRLAAAGFGIRQARAALYPQLRLTGSAGRLSAELADLLDNDLSVWSLAASLLQPVFQGGRLRAGVDLSEARYRELAERHVQAVLAAYGEVELALSAERFLARQTAALDRAAAESTAAQRLAEDRYNFGLGDYLAVHEAQRTAAGAQSRLLETRRQQLEARIDLYLALGGGWPQATEAMTGTTPEDLS